MKLVFTMVAFACAFALLGCSGDAGSSGDRATTSKAALQPAFGYFAATTAGKQCVVTKEMLDIALKSHRDCDVSIHAGADGKPEMRVIVAGLIDKVKMVECSGPAVGDGGEVRMSPMRCELLFKSWRDNECVAKNAKVTVKPKGKAVELGLQYDVAGGEEPCTNPGSKWRAQGTLPAAGTQLAWTLQK